MVQGITDNTNMIGNIINNKKEYIIIMSVTYILQESVSTSLPSELLEFIVNSNFIERCQLLKIKCRCNMNSASQPANHSKSPKWSPEVKTLKAFAIWPYYCTGRSYLGTKLVDELKYFSSVIRNY